MCLQCICNSKMISKVSDGWSLVQATQNEWGPEESPPNDNDYWKKGQYALVRLNDPDVILRVAPTLSISRSQFSASYEELSEYYQRLKDFSNDLCLELSVAESLLDSLKTAKFPLEVIGIWNKNGVTCITDKLYFYLAWLIEHPNPSH